MDQTLGPQIMQDPGPAAVADPTAMQNALMLQAIKGGASGGAAPPAPLQPTPAAPAMTGGAGSGPSPMPTPPVDPASMGGALGMPQMQTAMQQQAMQPPPQQSQLMQALMQGNIPGGGQ